MTSLSPSFSLSNPHGFLGLHETPEGGKVIRLFRPGAPYLHLELFGKIVEAHKTGEEGFFELTVPKETFFTDYRVYLYKDLLVHDPYAFWPTFGAMDEHLFGRGVHYKLHEMMGARVCTHQGVQGVKFVVWAPNAKRVAIVGDFNSWDGRVHPMRELGSSGVWELFIPGLREGERYKFEISSTQGSLLIKSDPYALFTEHRPRTASIVWNVDDYTWHDHDFLKQRRGHDWQAFPMVIYEVHLDSWKRRDGQPLNYRESAIELAAYCKKMGFTHVELLPIAEHPLDESWGYQVTGFYSVTSRMGTPRDFQFFVDHLHQEGIGVILDWVPAHFPSDEHALAKFDGTHLYEHADPRQGFHPHWNTCIFNYGRPEVGNFLLANALFWLEKMHIDGLRIDAVASILYLDYGREAGEWVPNREGGNYNLVAIEWLKHLNAILQEKFPDVHRIAEESTSFPGVSRPLNEGGLGFTMKWNMGWMNDTLRYFRRDSLFRSYHQNDLTFSLIYAFSERFVLPFSHDEVVHGKASMLAKMPGDAWQKWAQLRLILSYQLCQPGKKLLFMGAELGTWDEWNCKRELPWHLLNYDWHQKLHRFVGEMNHFYLANRALWERDFTHEGFEWIDFSDLQNCVISYLRKSTYSTLLVVHNFTPHTQFDYTLKMPAPLHSIEEVFNTDREEYSGSGKINTHVRLNGTQIEFTLAPLATLIFKVQF